MKKQFKDYWEMDQYIRTKIQSGISVADMMVIGDEVKKLESGQIYLEIGVSEGASLATAHFCAREGVFVIGIDIIDVVPVSKITVGRAPFMQQEEIVGIGKTGFYIHGDADEFSKIFPQKIDLIFIDGHHDYDSVKKNFDNWWFRLKKGGVALFHDYDHVDTKRFLDETFGDRKEVFHGKVVKAVQN